MAPCSAARCGLPTTYSTTSLIAEIMAAALALLGRGREHALTSIPDLLDDIEGVRRRAARRRIDLKIVHRRLPRSCAAPHTFRVLPHLRLSEHVCVVPCCWPALRPESSGRPHQPSPCSLPPPPAGRGGGGGFRGGSTIKPGEQCPPGTTEVRPLTCLAPEMAPPSILDYRPKSTLVAPTTMVRKAKFPVIDFHGHPAGLLATTETLARLGASLDSLNVRMMIAADNMSGDRLKRVMDTLRASPMMKDRVRRADGYQLR